MKGKKLGRSLAWRPGPKKVPVKVRGHQPGEPCDPFVYNEGFDLVKDRQVAGVSGIASVAPAGGHGVDRRPARLPSRGALAPAMYGSATRWSRVLPPSGRTCRTCPRGVVRGHVQGLKIVPIILHLGTFCYFEPHGDEDVFQFLPHLSDKVEMTSWRGLVDVLSQRPPGSGKHGGRFAQVQPL